MNAHVLNDQLWRTSTNMTCWMIETITSSFRLQMKYDCLYWMDYIYWMEDLFSESNPFFQQATSLPKIAPLTQKDILKQKEKQYEKQQHYKQTFSQPNSNVRKQKNYYENVRKFRIQQINDDQEIGIKTDCLYPVVKNINIFSQPEIRNNYMQMNSYLQNDKQVGQFMQSNKQYWKDRD